MTQSLRAERNYGIDLLRIISMYMIVVLHLIGIGNIFEYASLCSVEYELVWLLYLLAFPAVNCYALISGYVALETKQRYSRLFTLWLQVFFYSILITGGFFLLRSEEVSRQEIIQGFFPTITNSYWYFTAYVGLFIIMPILVAAVDKLSRKVLQQILLGGFILLSVLPMITNTDIFGTADGYSTLWLSYLFFVGAYVKKYQPLAKVETKWLWMAAGGCIFLTLAVKFVVEYVSWNYMGTLFIYDAITKYTSPLVVVEAVILVALFARMKLGESWIQIVKVVTPLSFGVYLIHNHILMYGYVITSIHEYLFTQSLLVTVVGILLVAFAIFVICIFIDYLRMQLFKLLKIKESVSKVDRLIKTE